MLPVSGIVWVNFSFILLHFLHVLDNASFAYYHFDADGHSTIHLLGKKSPGTECCHSRLGALTVF